MAPHRYCIGQTVRFVKTAGNIAFGETPAGDFRIVGVLPDYRGDTLYCVESTSDSQQRVVIESEIFST